VASAAFSSLATVVGVGVMKLDHGYGIKVNLENAPHPSVALPDSVEGVPVREVVGSIHKLLS